MATSLAPRIALLVALFSVSGLALSEPTVAQSTVPSHCERDTGGETWPALGEPVDTTGPAPVTHTEARRAVHAFRAAWRSVPHASAVLRSFTECMDASLEHFTVRRVSVAHARRSVEELATGSFASLVLSGSASALPTTGWVWEVYWGGASRRHPPSGPVSAYFSPDLHTLHASIQWPEG
jgi:hypothetical protein